LKGGRKRTKKLPKESPRGKVITLWPSPVQGIRSSYIIIRTKVKEGKENSEGKDDGFFLTTLLKKGKTSGHRNIVLKREGAS